MMKEIKAYIDARFDRLEALAQLGAKEVVNLEEAAMLTGYRKESLYVLTCGRRIPHYKRNRRLYFRRSELEAWLTEHRVLTEEEIESRAETYTMLNRKDMGQWERAK